MLREIVPVHVPSDDRRRHTYITGGSGAGKSELLKLLIESSMHDVEESAVVVLDPHGDLVEQVAHWPELQIPIGSSTSIPSCTQIAFRF